MIDFHVHCDYSIDAQGSVEEYIEKALDVGLTEICFTTHCDLEPARRHHDGRVRVRGRIVDVTSAWIESYIEEVRSAAQKYSSENLKVLCGLEVGFVPGIEPEIEKVIHQGEFDFILGGIHTLEGIDIVSNRESGEYFKKKTPRQLCETYFHYADEAVKSGLFDAIAHLDIYKKCGLAFYGEVLERCHEGLVESVLEEMARQRICIEVNSGALRKGLLTPYPSIEILRLAKEIGVEGVTIGSDCHKPDDIGRDLERCLRQAEQAGFSQVFGFRARERYVVPIEELKV